MSLKSNNTYKTIGDQVRASAKAFPDRKWIVTRERSATFSEMDSLSDGLAHGLSALGVSHGDTVLAMLPNTIDFVAVFCALGKMGALQVPVNTAYKGGILRHLVNDSSAKVMIVDRQFIDRLEFLVDELDHLETLIVYSEKGTSSEDLELSEGLSKRCSAVRFESVLVENSGAFERDLKAHELMGVLYTSGTTGPSKGVMTTHAHCYTYSYGPIECGFLREGDVYYAPLPLFHIGGMWAVIYSSCIAGATAVLIPTFSVSRFWQDVEDYDITCAFLLGAMVNFVYKLPRQKEDASTSLQHVLMAPVIPQVDDFMKRYGCKVWTVYGQTEACCPIYGDGSPPNGDACGRIVSDQFELRIVDENDFEVPDGETGELVVRTRDPWVLMAGYWKNPEATAAAWRNQWLHTGDLLKRDADGWYYFVDRKKDALRRRGENISSIEVENEINAHPDVVESAVFPVPADDAEDEVMAVVVLREGADLSYAQLTRFLEPRMAYFMVPRHLEFQGELPKTPTGKIQKAVLRDRGISASTWDREAAGVKLKR